MVLSSPSISRLDEGWISALETLALNRAAAITTDNGTSDADAAKQQSLIARQEETLMILQQQPKWEEREMEFWSHVVMSNIGSENCLRDMQC